MSVGVVSVGVGVGMGVGMGVMGSEGKEKEVNQMLGIVRK